MIGKCPSGGGGGGGFFAGGAWASVHGFWVEVVCVAGALAAGCVWASVVVAATGGGSLGTVCANAAAPVPHVSAATASEVRTIRPTSAAPGAKAMRGVIRG